MSNEPKEWLDINLTVNGKAVSRRVSCRKHLTDFLREDLDLTGSHLGCEHGVCGACTVKLDGNIVRGCLLLAVQCNGARVETIEGMSESGELSDLQQAFHELNAFQCGFCTPAMLITASELCYGGHAVTRDDIRKHLSGNYCRCTGYQAIVDAVHATCIARGQGAVK